MEGGGDAPVPISSSGRRTRKQVNYKDLEDQLDYLVGHEEKEKERERDRDWKKERDGRSHKRVKVPAYDETDLVALQEDFDEDVDAMDVERLQKEIEKVKGQIKQLEEELEKDPQNPAGDAEAADEEIEFEAFEVPPHSVPIRTDVRAFDWDALAKEVQFDVIVMDPPWQLATAAPTRGVALGYRTLPNYAIKDIPVPKMQKNGFIFMWVVNSRYNFALEMLENWGYTLVDDITWVKHTVHRKFAKGHGFYLQHAKESCLVGKKGRDPPTMVGNVCSDVIYSERRGQSQKPEQLYQIIEQLVPGGTYLEIFARRNNLRNYWVSIGLEL